MPAWGIYGPSLIRADAATDSLACQRSEFSETDQIVQAMKSGAPEDALRVLGAALREWRTTPETSVDYSARAFCIHELVPSRLPRQGKVGSSASTRPTALAIAFARLGIHYFYYEPDAEWTLENDPVDLNALATKHLDSRWGREAFLLMTQIGWSQGACKEGPDQFRDVIKHGESFLDLYPRSEISEMIRLDLANAYATWWNLSRSVPSPQFSPAPYQAGADMAKERSIELYREYLDRQNVPITRAITNVRNRLQALQRDPKGSKTYDYFCAGYED